MDSTEGEGEVTQLTGKQEGTYGTTAMTYLVHCSSFHIIICTWDIPTTGTYIMHCQFEMATHMCMSGHAYIVCACACLCSHTSHIPAYIDDQIDLYNLQGALSSVAEKWYTLGLCLDLSAAELHDIESEREKDPSCYLNGVLKLWVERVDSKPSWKVLIDALRHIEASDLADSLQERFGGCINM